jgi:enolase
MFIKEVDGKLIKDSRGERTIQVTIKTYKGTFTASAPSGKSRGKNEVPQYNQRGIEWSLKMLGVFSRNLVGKNFMIKKFSDLKNLYVLIKKFEARFGRLGGNTTYALECAFLKAAAKENDKQLWQFINDEVNNGKKPKMPMPVGNCIGGGLHTLAKGGRPDFQEFLLIPQEETFSKALTKNVHAYYSAKKLIKRKEGKWIMRVNDEGAWKTELSNTDALDILAEVAKKFNLRIGLDVAASTFYEKGYYNYKHKELMRDRLEQMDYIQRLIEKYNLFYVEDPLQEEDISGFLQLSNNVKKNVLIVGDDLTTTNYLRARTIIREKAINSMIIKPNQIGSLIEVAKVVQLCKENNIKMIFSHRSGETMDDALADFCVGFGGDFIKTGIHGRERLIKLRRVMEIEKSLK